MTSERKCYWNEWARNKARVLTLEEVMDDEDIVECYTCKNPNNRCASYIGKLYMEDLK